MSIEGKGKGGCIKICLTGCLILLIIYLFGFVIDYFFPIIKGTNAVSESISKSKERGVFLHEYRVVDLQELDTIYKFPIKSAWTERVWALEIDSITKKKKVVINQNVKGQIIWELYNNDTIFAPEKYLEKWIISSLEKKPTGIHGIGEKMILISFMPDSLSMEDNGYTIYLLNSNHVFDTIKNTAIFKFRLKEQGY